MPLQNNKNGDAKMSPADSLLWMLGGGKNPIYHKSGDGSMDTDWDVENVLAYNDWQTVSSPSSDAQHLANILTDYAYTGEISVQ